MEKRIVDVAVIGAGTAGITAYRAAHAHGARTVMIESGPYGTTCARVGCMPSKLLIAASEAAHTLRTASGFGVHADAPRIDGRAVMARVREERDRFVGFVLDGMDKMPPEDKLRGKARFTGPHTLLVDEHTEVQAARIVLATGSAPVVPAQLAALGAQLDTSDTMFEWDTLPGSVAVVGAGVIGLELGLALARLGVRVSVFARGAGLAQLSDPAVLAVAQRVLGEELDLHLHTGVVDARAAGDGVLLSVRDGGGGVSMARFDRVLAAAGRSPNVQGLGLEHSGLALDAHGVPLFDGRTMRCGDSHIFIAGDAAAERALLPEAADMGKIAGDNAGRYPDVRPGLRRTPLAIAFTAPDMASAGASHRTLSAPEHPAFGVGQASFANQGRSRVMLQHRGLLRVYGEYGTGRFLGAEMIAPRGEHLAHLLAWAAQARMTVAQMLEMPFYHPVVEEGVRTALRDLASCLAKAPHETDVADSEPGV